MIMRLSNGCVDKDAHTPTFTDYQGRTFLADKISEKGSLLFLEANLLVYLGNVEININSISSCHYEKRFSYSDGSAYETDRILYAKDGWVKVCNSERSAGPSWDDYSDYMETDDYVFLSFSFKNGRGMSRLEYDDEVWGWLVDYFRLKNQTSVSITAGDFVDLDLPSGTLWSSRNVGAKTPEESGDQFSWGETDSKTEEEEGRSSYKWYSKRIMTKYNGNEKLGPIDNKYELELNDDAAYVNCDSSCRMPSREQIDELIECCEWEKTNYKGSRGYLVKGKNGNCIFLPNPLQDCCGYWSRSLRTGGSGWGDSCWFSYVLWFSCGAVKMHAVARVNVNYVRPVRDKLK